MHNQVIARSHTASFGFLAGVLFLTGAAAAAQPDAAPSALKAEFAQILTPGKDGVPKALNPDFMVMHGNFLYVGTASGIQYYRRDVGTNVLSYVDTVPGPSTKGGVSVCAAGKYLYAAQLDYGKPSHFVVCYEIEPATGKPVEKCRSEVLTDGDGFAGSLMAGPDGRDVYFGTWGSLVHAGLDADGKLVKKEQVGGKGLGASVVMSPDGKFLYSMMSADHAIGCVARQADGTLVYTNTVSLAAVCPADGNVWHFQMNMAGISPDGTWLYAQLHAPNAESFWAVYKRDPATGALTLKESGSGSDASRADFRLANIRGRSLRFLPDGKGGFAGSASGVLQTFRCDPATGRLSDIVDVAVFVPHCLPSSQLGFDAQKNLLFGCGPGWTQTPSIWVMKVELPLPRGNRADITAPLVGTSVPTGPAAAADWPRRCGPNADMSSPIKGIVKDWSGGLKKVWEVRGLSPGTCSYSTTSVKGNKLVVTGQHGTVWEIFCFDADKGGAPLWLQEVDVGDGTDYGWGDGPYATPCITDDSVYVASKAAQMTCLNLADGRIKWIKPLAGACHGYGSCPLVWGDLVIASGVDNAQLGALNRNTGAKAWTWDGKKTTDLQHSSPMLRTINGVEQIVFKSQVQMTGLDRAGKQLWLYDATNAVLGTIPTPALSGNIIAAIPPLAMQIEGGNAACLWRDFKGSNEKYETCSMADPAVINGCIYAFVVTTKNGRGSMWGGGAEGFMVCADLKTGNIKWIEPTGQGSLLVVDGLLLCLNYDGKLFLVKPNPEKFEKLTECQPVKPETWMHHGVPYPAHGHQNIPFWAMPIAARGKLYIRYSDQLACFDLMGK